MQPIVAKAQQLLAIELSEYMSAADVKTVLRACTFADKAHEGIKRKSGEPYILHPIAVAQILTQEKLDVDTICAALLHDVIEDTEHNKEEVTHLFNATIASLVDGVTKLEESDDKQTNKAATFKKILLATLHDPRVLILKLADRLHNLSTLDAVKPEKRYKLAQETIEFLVPLGRLIGYKRIVDQIELLCLQNLDTPLFTRVESFLKHKLHERQALLHERMTQFYTLAEEYDLNINVRPKFSNLYVYQAAFKNKTDLKSLVGMVAFEVSLPTVAACDEFCDALKKYYQFYSEEDFIRHPKAGGQQYILLQLQDELGLVQLEVSTNQMQALSYQSMTSEHALSSQRSILQASLNNLQQLIDPNCAKTTLSTLIEYLRFEKIIAYTPKLDVIELPVGATMLDFAYAASIYVGHRALSASVLDVAQPMSAPVQNGDVIHIQTQSEPCFKPEWLGFVQTKKAKRAIAQSLANLSQQQKQDIGLEALQAACTHLNFEWQQVTVEQMAQLCNWLHLPNVQAIYEQIGNGQLEPQLVAARLYSLNRPQDAKGSPIAGLAGISYHLAQCCSPIHGDKIVGHLTKRGLIVHRKRCKLIAQDKTLHPERVVSLAWEQEINTASNEQMYLVTLELGTVISVEESPLLIALIEELQAGVAYYQAEDYKTRVTIMVRDRKHLAEVIRALRLRYNCPQVERMAEVLSDNYAI